MTIYTTLGYPHIAAALIAYVAAFAIFFSPKGTANHKRMGRIFVIAILTVSTTGVLMYLETGRMSIFYIFAALTYIAIARALLAIRRYASSKDTEDLFMHYREMAGAFLALNLAGVAQGMRLLPFESSGQFIIAILVIYIPVILAVRYLVGGPLRKRLGL